MTGVVYDSRTCGHRALSDDHVEAPLRGRFITAQLEDTGVMKMCRRVAAREATDEELLLVHTEEYIKLVKSTRMGTKLGDAVKDNDVYSCLNTDLAARLSCGGLVALTKKIATGELKNGFSISRPPGHHANPAVASGFCIYSNVAIAAKVAQQQPLVQKVLIFDWDVHHGNGTEWVHYNDPSVLTISVHGHGNGRTHNMRSSLKRKLREVDRAELAAAKAAEEEGKNERRAQRARTRESEKKLRKVSRANGKDTDGDEKDSAAGDEGDADALDWFASLGWYEEDPEQQSNDLSDGEEDEEQEAKSLKSTDDSSGGTHFSDLKMSNGTYAADTNVAIHDALYSDAVQKESGSLFYPGTGFGERVGIGKGVGYNINVPWPCDGFGDVEYLRVVNEIVLPAGREFKPDIVIISAGFDSALGDKLGSMRVTPTGFALMTEAIAELAGGKMVVCLEGGYNSEVVATCAEATVRTLLRLSGEPNADRNSFCIKDQVFLYLSLTISQLLNTVMIRSRSIP
ncbi:Histone deacetylase HDA1 [Diplonema papillatum]|nr:Histone deacetylase HDA1 [Diplonema papillatum]